MNPHTYLKLLLICILSILYMQVKATTDSLFTQYTNRTFHTYCHIQVPCSKQIAEEVLDDFIAQFRGDPNILFEWALKDLGSQSGDDFTLNLKETTYDEQTGIGVIYTDVIVHGITSFNDVFIESKIEKNYVDNNSIEVLVDIFNSNLFISKASGSFHIIPVTSNSVIVSIDVHIRFAWFFDLFISQRLYKKLVEWRIQGFLQNMHNEMLARHS